MLYIVTVSIVTAVVTQSPALLTKVTEMSPTAFTTRPVVNVYGCTLMPKVIVHLCYDNADACIMLHHNYYTSLSGNLYSY